MATTLPGYQPQIAERMAAGSADLLQWLSKAHFALASSGHYIAWKEAEHDRAMVLPPDHPAGEPGQWIESWESDPKIEDFIAYVESGDFDKDEPQVLNIFIEDPPGSGNWV